MDAIYVIAIVLIVFALIFIKGMADAKAEKKAILVQHKNEYGGKRSKKLTPKEISQLEAAFYSSIDKDAYYIDDITFNDLDGNRLLERIDKTITYPGLESLYFMLRLPKGEAELEKEERIISYFFENEADRLKVIKLLLELRDLKGKEFIKYMGMLAECRPLSGGKHIICLLLAILALSTVFIAPFAGFFLMIVALAYNFSQYFKAMKQIRPYLAIFSSIMQVVEYADRVSKLNISAIADINNDIDILTKATKKNASLFKIVIGNKSALGGFVDLFFDYIKMYFHIDLLFFNTCLDMVKNNQDVYIRLWRYIGDIDAYISIGDFRASLNHYCLPSFEGDGVIASRLYHPLLTDPVANDVDIRSCILLTGSNASGKSTFLKTVALNALLAQTIHTVCAKEYKAAYFKIMTSMSLRDNIAEADSFYIAEIKSLKRIIDDCDRNERLLICIDEILKGTNTYERISAAEAILRYFSDKQVICLGATHDLELAQLLADKYSNFHFSEVVKPDGIAFPYKLERGITNTRNAIKLLDVMGFDNKIVAKASDNYKRICEEGIWK